MTRGQIIAQIRRIIYNGYPPDDADVTELLTNQYLNEGIGLAIAKNYSSSLQIDNVGSVSDGFIMTFSGFTITKDNNTQYYSITLPQIPLALPRKDSITNVFLFNPSKIKIEGCRINPKELSYMFGIPLDDTQIYFWTEGLTMFLWAFNKDLTKYNIYVRMPFTQSSTLTDEVNCPDDYLADVINYTLQLLMAERNQPKILNNEATGIANAKPN
jgi:hypothetical protein